ncbi:MAG: hypothetical protein NXI04_01385 [Planctomycetaceae bacterium]|nr:hypothetical protein [Planctomycetaceae bacterium]
MDLSLVAPQLIRAARRSPAAGEKKLRSLCGSVADQIETDARRRGPLSFWGRSVNCDEITKTDIVDPAVIAVLGRIAGKTLSSTTPHAGLQHTYGYLFSVIQTPYGMKRDRWTETGLEAALGIPPDSLGPQPTAGTLLTNATWLAGRIAYRRHRREQTRLADWLEAKATPELVDKDFERLPHQRITESVKDRRTGTWQLQTDLVCVQKQRHWLLVYSLRHVTRNIHQLITLFPVTDANRLELIERAVTPRRTDIRLRFNAWLPRMTGELTGSCRLTEF